MNSNTLFARIVFMPNPRRFRKTSVLVYGAAVITGCVGVATAWGDATDTFYGTGAGASITTGINDAGFGVEALNADTTGDSNTATGYEALDANTSGNDNTADGWLALGNNVTGGNNTAVGCSSLYHNHGSNNTASGLAALYSNDIGTDNTASGYFTLAGNSTGNNNTATGASALRNSTTASYNTADGYQALYSDTTGAGNLADGFDSLYSNTTGNYNMGQGPQALYANTTGNANTAIGVNALVQNTTGGTNVGIGANAGLNLTTGSNNIDIANNGVAAEANTTRIGSSQTKTFIAGISGVTVSGGVAVYVSSTGQLGTSPSSRRFKEDIAPMNKASETLLSLKPVTFRYKAELDPARTAQFGLVAEDVAKIDPDLVARDNRGEIYSVRYEAVNAMLLNEFLKEHARVEAQNGKQQKLEAIVAEQQQEISAFKDQGAKMQQQIAELTSAMQRVSAQLATRKPVGQLAANGQ